MIAVLKPFEARSEKVIFFSIVAVLVLMLLLNTMVQEGSSLHFWGRGF